MGSYVYLVQPSEYIGTDVYKIGHTQQKNDERLKQYGKNYILIAQVAVSNSKIMEDKLMKVFKNNYTCHRPNEYFQGDLSKMLKDFLQVVSSDILHEMVIGNWRHNDLEAMPSYWVLKWIQKQNHGMVNRMYNRWFSTSKTVEQWWNSFPYQDKCNNKQFINICFKKSDKYFNGPIFVKNNDTYTLCSDTSQVKLIC